MRRATISNLASVRSQDRATSCRHYARDDRTNRNQYNCLCGPAVSSPRPFAHETFFPAAACHPTGLVYPPRAGAEESRASFATPDDRAQEMNSANPQRIPVGSEIPATENDRVLQTRRDQESDPQSQRPHAVCLVAVGKRQREDSPTESANPVQLR